MAALYDMGVFDAIENPNPAAPAAGVFDSVEAPTPATVPSAGVFANISTAPKPAPAGPASPYFQGTEPSGAFLGISDQTDPYSGRPFFAYRLPGATSTTTDTTRVAPKVNPELATTTPKDEFENPRMPESASEAVRAAQGATSDQELDHRMALAVGGSNDSSNLKLVPTAQNQAASMLEGQMAQEISQGKTTLFQAQAAEAKAKGLPPPFTDNTTPPAKAGLLSTVANAPDNSVLGTIRNTILGVPAAAAKVAQIAGGTLAGVAQGIIQQYTNPSPLEQSMEANMKAPGPLTPLTQGVLRTVEPMVEPLVSDITAAAMFKQPELYNDLLDNIQKNGPNWATMQVTTATQKTPVQIVGDTAQAVLGAYLPDIVGESLDGFASKGIIPALTTATTHGAAAGAAFGVAQAASSGSTDPKEIAAIILRSTIAGAMLNLVTGAVTHGAAESIPTAVDAIKARLPQNLQDAQRGFVHIPGLGDLPEEGDIPKNNQEKTPENALTKPSNPQEAKFDETNGGYVPIPPVRNPEELTQEIKETQDYLAYAKDQVDIHPAKGLLKYYGNQDPRSENLDDIFARNVEKGTGAKSGKLDSIVSELGYQSVSDAQKGVTDYMELRDQTKALTEHLKTLQSEQKSLADDAKLSDKQRATKAKAIAAQQKEFMAKSRAEAKQRVKEGPQVPGLTRRVVEDRNGTERLTPDPLQNPSNFYQRMGELKKLDPERSLNQMTHISSQDIGDLIQRMKDRQAASEAKRTAIETSQKELPYRLSFKDKILGNLKPISHLPQEIKDIATRWQRGQLEAVEKANKEYNDLPGAVTKIAKDGAVTLIKKSPLDKSVPTDQAVRDYTAIQHGAYTPLRNVFDRLYEYAEKAGLDVPYRKNYLPQVYREPLGEVKSSLVQYMLDQGVDRDDAEGYVQGVMALPTDVALRLKINPSFVESKAFPTYGVAAKYGLTPKFTNPADLVANYRFELEKTINNKSFVNTLIDKAKLLPGGLSPDHWEHVTTNFVKGDLYAPPELARMLNGLYQDQAEMGIWDTAVHYLGLVSRKAQEITLSGAIPYTNIHFFSVGQLIKEMTAGNFKAIEPFIRSNSVEATEAYFKENQLYTYMMARQGIDISGRMGSIRQIFSRLSRDPTWYNKIGIEFEKAFLDKSFGTFLPSLYTQVFKDTYDGAIGRGMDANAAEKFAGDVTRTNFGLLGTEARANATKDSLSTIFFAPQFRESVFGTLSNAFKSISTEIKNPAFYRSRRLVGGMAFTFGMYNVFNKMMNGQYMWQNPNGHEFELRIPLPDGNNMYIPWMPSFLALPRAGATAAISVVKGDVGTAEQQTANLFSLPLQVAIQVLANKDYFGSAIYKPTDTGVQVAEKIAAYVGLQINHPYVRAVADMIMKKQPLYQTLSEAATLPLKFQTDTSISQGAFYDALDASATKNAQSQGDTAGIYNQVQSLIASGDKAGAQKIVDGLTDAQYKQYTDYKTAQKSKTTVQTEAQQFATYQQVQSLLKTGDKAGAQKIVDGMTDADYHAYTLLKNRFGND